MVTQLVMKKVKQVTIWCQSSRFKQVRNGQL